MNGFIFKKIPASVGLGALMLALVGCHKGNFHCDNLVDPCYPERYNAMARKEVREPFQAQATNGHILDQTVWNWHFERDFETDPKTGAPTPRPTARLSPAGRDYLTHIVRRRPCPDPKVFLQTAQDLAYDPARPDDMLKKRTDLDAKRQEAVQSFLGIQAAGRRLPYEFQVAVHDPHEVGFSAIPLAGTESGLTPMQRPSGVIDVRDLNFQQGLQPGAATTGGSSVLTLTQ